MPSRLDIQRSDWFPVQTFFNAVSDEDFVRMVGDLLANIDWHIDVCHCEFPENLEPGEEPFDGVKFSIYEDEIILSREQFLTVLEQVCEAQRRRRPEETKSIDEVLTRRSGI